MKKTRPALSDAIGTDSFLDIVANLVGILLIFLMVIGVRMEDASQAALPIAPNPQEVAKKALAAKPLPAMPVPQEFPDVEIPDVSAAQMELSKLQAGIRDADEEAIKLAQEMKLHKLDRDNLMLAITNAERTLDERRASLGSAQQEQVKIELALEQAREDYDSIMGQLDSVQLANENPKTEVIQHVATPIAKTVFLREEHFRLLGGRLLYVPLNDFTNELKSDAPKKIWKLKKAKQTTETIGPHDGFEMRYTLRRNRVPFQTESGLSAVRELVELDRFVMVPVGNLRGETVEEAISSTSSLRNYLARWSPRDTIITIWTYPDSFAEFRKLRSELYKIGYRTAARPLPAGELISGSPNGTKSAAQ